MGTLTDLVKKEVHSRSQRGKELPEEVEEMLKEVFEHNDACRNNNLRLGVDWVSNRLIENGYQISPGMLNRIAVQMGRTSWSKP